MSRPSGPRPRPDGPGDPGPLVDMAMDGFSKMIACLAAMALPVMLVAGAPALSPDGQMERVERTGGADRGPPSGMRIGT